MVKNILIIWNDISNANSVALSHVTVKLGEFILFFFLITGIQMIKKRTS